MNMKRASTNYVISSYFIVIIIFLTSCGTPVLNNLDPLSGPVGTIVTIDGGNLSGANIYWDYGTAAQTSLRTNFLSAHHFTVPLGASLGAHPVRLSIGSTFSANTISFNVINGVVRPKPRIDYLTCFGYNINQAGKASFLIFCSGANIDVGASLNVNGTDMVSFISQVLRNTNMTATNPATLGYPIFNYCMLWTVLSDQTPGAALTVKIKNLDGTLSDAETYNIAPSMAQLDSDGDGLLDDWEKNGYDANGDGTVDIDLPSLGADPNHKDLFVEADWMNGFAPNNATWATMEAAYTNAPVLNANGVTGIAAHIDRGQAGAGGGGGSVITMSNYIRYDNDPSPSQLMGQTTANFYTLKTANFNANRLRVYRYCIFANDNGYQAGSSGRAENIWANDFFVSLGGWPTPGGTINQQIGTFLHELGHTLNLFHGGFENDNNKPSYNSIMRYGSPGQVAGIDNNCNNAGDNIFTYSQGMRADLNESSLNENAGVCDNNGVDWNGNGSFQNPVAQDINASGTKTVLKDFADWGKLKINFTSASSNWGSN